MAIAAMLPGPQAAFKSCRLTRGARCALLAAAAVSGWAWQAAPALAQGAPKVRIITGNGDFLIDLRPPAAAGIGLPLGPAPNSADEQTSPGAAPAAAVATAPASVPLALSTPSPEPVISAAPTADPALSATVLAQDTAPAPAPQGLAAAAPSPAGAATRASASDAVQAAVRTWASAWAGKDLNAYFASYGSGFAPPGNQPRQRWEDSRRARIAAKQHISITLSDLVIAVQDGLATARFKQHYSAGALNISSRKMLQLTQEANERWVIVREAAGH